MKRAAVVPPEVIAVAVTVPVSASTGASRRKSLSLKRSLSNPTSISRSGNGNASAIAQTPCGENEAAAPPADAAVVSSSFSLSLSEAEETIAAVVTATTPMRTVSDPGAPPTLPLLLSTGSAGTLRETNSEREMVFVPLAIAYLEQVKMDITVTKQHSDIRYVMTVAHTKLQLKWRNARSFDEYRKLQQRLLKLLHHGHFCSADCPWMFTFLKSYFPKKHIFNFSSARVVDARKAALERFFVTAQSFLLNRMNHGCGFMTAAFANELVDFIYGDVLKQYPLDKLTNVQTTASGVLPGLPQLRGRSLTDSLASSCSDEELESLSSSAVDPICQICDASLYGEAFAGKDRANSSLTGRSSSSLESLELDMIATSLAAAAGVISVSPTSSSWSSTDSTTSDSKHQYRRNTHYVTTLECGHQFHDECIVPKLNETLRCPTCGHLEVK